MKSTKTPIDDQDHQNASRPPKFKNRPQIFNLNPNVIHLHDIFLSFFSCFYFCLNFLFPYFWVFHFKIFFAFYMKI